MFISIPRLYTHRLKKVSAMGKLAHGSISLAFANSLNVGTQFQALSIQSTTRSKCTLHRKRSNTDLNRVVPVSELQFERLGTSDLKVSPIALGTMTWGSQNTPEEAEAQMDYAIKERNVNFLDTAEMYPSPMKKAPPGTSERIIGDYLAKNRHLRSEIILASKVVGFMPNSRIAAARYTDNPPKDGSYPPSRLSHRDITDACDASLRRLRTDYIDLYQIHWPERYLPNPGSSMYDRSKEREDTIPLRETLAALKQLLSEGKIRAYGLSNDTAYGLSEVVHTADMLNMPRPCSIQNQYCLLNRIFESTLAEPCSPLHYNVSLLPYSILGAGALSGKLLGKVDDQGRVSDPALQASRLVQFEPFQKRFWTKPAAEATLAYKQIADEAGMSLATLAQAFCKGRPFIGSSIIGATSVEQLRENIDAFDITLCDDVLAKIDQVHFANKDLAICG